MTIASGTHIYPTTEERTEEVVALRERVAALEKHRSTWRRIAWRFEDALREVAPERHGQLEIDVYANGETMADRGELINRCASLGMTVTRLRAELPEVEKQTRKTPRRDMHDERAKVDAAKKRVAPMRAELEKAEADYASVRDELVRLGALPDPRPTESNSDIRTKDNG